MQSFISRADVTGCGHAGRPSFHCSAGSARVRPAKRSVFLQKPGTLTHIWPLIKASHAGAHSDCDAGARATGRSPFLWPALPGGVLFDDRNQSRSHPIRYLLCCRLRYWLWRSQLGIRVSPPFSLSLARASAGTFCAQCAGLVLWRANNGGRCQSG